MAEKEAVVGQVNDWQDGQMKQVTVGETDILVARVAGQYHAIGAYCTHYGAPLVEGVLSGSRVVCPWHHACFSVTSGDHEEPPGFDCLPHFEVRIDGDDIVVCVPDDAPTQRTPDMAKPDTKADERLFAILGAGVAGAAAAETLRQVGFQGRLVLITGEGHVPYDRTVLSKAYLAGEQEDIGPLRDVAFYDQHGIEVQANKPVARVDTTAQQIEFMNGEELSYHTLLVATGGSPRQLNVRGTELDGVFRLRTPEDAQQIIAAAKNGTRGVIIGASFISMECAASLRQRDVKITVVAPESAPLALVLGPAIGQMYKNLHEANGVSFVLEAAVEQLVGEDKVEKVVVRGGQAIEADFVVMGVGVQPATEFLRGVARNEDESVSVDAHLCVARTNSTLYAAGDIATFPDPVSGAPIRIEHWRLAQQHGRTAALNMAGIAKTFDQVPFFWTGQYGLSLGYVGHAKEWDDIVFEGDLEQHDFLAYYLTGDQVQAVAGMGREQALCAIEECLRLQKMPPIQQLRQGRIDWVAQLR
jgi:NADPH-dependent 2,4-dienoyl-CoA reductase/sulfur reductase-like enzyme/nitrite reductase/ring-hydroxylating ferredoxin subunit